MRTALLIAADEGLRARLLRALADCSVFFARTDADAFKALRLIDVDVVLRDSGGAGHDFEAFAGALREIAPQALTIAVGEADLLGEAADFVLPSTFTERDLAAALRKAGDRQRLAREVSALRAQTAARPSAASPETEPAWDGRVLARVLKEFARAFAAGFDLRRALDMILDAIGELVRPTRSALLMPDETGPTYRVVAHRGLPPFIVESLRLPASAGLCQWMVAQGRPARLADLPPESPVARELGLAQGAVAVPLLSGGELVAVLVVGQPVFGAAYGRQETETLFDLATHLATGIRDITLHHQLQREKEFSERILAHMASGVVTIGRDERVGLMNRRAEEILGLTAAEVVGEDLRALPSPLGDMLYDTLSTGRSLSRLEVQVALRGLALEVSTYPVRGDDAAPLGAVLVFEDLTATKQLAAQKRQAEQLQLLTRVVARIADEIKNPLVSVNTFMELIQERYDDPSFRKEFSTVVGSDVRRLVEVFEKLAALVSEGELHLAAVDARSIVADTVAFVEADAGAAQQVRIEVTLPDAAQPVTVDALQLRRALAYLVWYLRHMSSVQPTPVAISVGTAERQGDVTISVGARTAIVPGDILLRLFDPVQMAQESLIDLGPAVSQRLVEAQGGRLTGRPSRTGFVFTVTLPAASA